MKNKNVFCKNLLKKLAKRKLYDRMSVGDKYQGTLDDYSWNVHILYPGGINHNSNGDCYDR